MPPERPSRRAQPNRPLVLALARAHCWQRMIESGEVDSLASLSDRLALDRSYVRRIMQLTSLSPALSQRILMDDTGISLAVLHKDLQVRWDRQVSHGPQDAATGH